MSEADGRPPTATGPAEKSESRHASRERLACVHVPALPLQLLVRRHREWADRPVAVVDEDRPQGTILWVNDAARRHRVLPGLRYAAGLSLCRDLCAGAVPEAEIERGVRGLVELLWRFSPEVEPAAGEPGVFWLDATGLERLEQSLASAPSAPRPDPSGVHNGLLAAWARRLRAALKEEGFVARLAVGFSRFGTYATARTGRGVVVLPDPERERRRARQVRLDRLHVDHELRDALAKLGVHTVGQFLGLPPEGLGKRFGAEALDLWRRARGEEEKLLDPVPPPAPIETCIEIGFPETDSTQLLFLVKRLLPELLAELADRGQGLTELILELRLEDGDRQMRHVRPADATLDAAVVIDLVRLRLDSVDLSGGVVEVQLTARGVRLSDEQLALFRSQPKRDLAAANRAFARLRAEFGDDTVVRARPQDAHLPEASFIWEPLDEARFPAQDNVDRDVSTPDGLDRGVSTPGLGPSGNAARRQHTSEPVLIRRLYDRPRLLPARERHEPDGWLISDLEQGPVVRMRGPYVVSGGWWVREVHREYYFVETKRGDVLWVYYDRNRRRWLLHGQVE